jgi:hypothetical protein
MHILLLRFRSPFTLFWLFFHSWPAYVPGWRVPGRFRDVPGSVSGVSRGMSRVLPGCSRGSQNPMNSPWLVLSALLTHPPFHPGPAL